VDIRSDACIPPVLTDGLQEAFTPQRTDGGPTTGLTKCDESTVPLWNCGRMTTFELSPNEMMKLSPFCFSYSYEWRHVRVRR